MPSSKITTFSKKILEQHEAKLVATDSGYPFFPLSELTCKCGCGAMETDPNFLWNLVAFRIFADFPFPLSSAYRCPRHDANTHRKYTDKNFKPLERFGAHTIDAVDVAAFLGRAHFIVTNAARFGMKGVGVKQKGPRKNRFIHLDGGLIGNPRPTIWSYNA